MLLKRLLSAGLTLLVMGLLIFLLVDWLPGDTCSAMLGQDAQVDTLHQCRQQLGLDQPAIDRLLQWFHQLLAGDTGCLSAETGKPARLWFPVSGTRCYWPVWRVLAD